MRHRRLDDRGCFISAMMQAKKESTTDMLLLQDGTFNQLPTHIHRAFECLRNNRPSKMHILRALVYIVSLESGFYTVDSTEPFNNKSGCFNIVNVKKNIDFVSKLSQDETVLTKLALTDVDDCNYKLLTREIGDALCITFSYGNRPGKSIYLSASRYVLSATLKDPPKCFNNLNELSFKLKETIFTPIRNNSLESNNESFPSLIGLPSEVVWMVFNKLNQISLQNLSKTCMQMNNEIKNYRDSRFNV